MARSWEVIPQGETWAVRSYTGVLITGFAERERAEQVAREGAEADHRFRRKNELTDALFAAASADRVPFPEVWAAVDAKQLEPLEQLAAQYGLLKPGTQVAK